MKSRYTVKPKALVQIEVTPIKTRLTGEGTLLLDYRKAAFGTQLIQQPYDTDKKPVVIHLGENYQIKTG